MVVYLEEHARYPPQFGLGLIFEDYITQKRFLAKRERDYVIDWVLVTQYLIYRHRQRWHRFT